MLFQRRKIQISVNSRSHQLLLLSLSTPSEPGPDPACNYTLHFTDVVNPTGDSTGTQRGEQTARLTLSSLLAPSRAQAPVSSAIYCCF